METLDVGAPVPVPVPLPPARSLFVTKTFWVNALMVILDALARFHGIVPAKYEAPTFLVVNSLLRLISDTPVTLKGR